jgi:hypothetical protein
MGADISLQINKDYTVNLWIDNNLHRQYSLDFDKSRLKDQILNVSTKLEQILQDNTNYDEGIPLELYRGGIKIPLTICNDGLRKIAKLRLSEFIFPNKDSNAQDCKEIIMEIAERIKPLRIRIVAPADFIFPWPLLYNGEIIPNKEINKEQIWGFNYIIEDQLPYQQLNYGKQIKTSDLVIGFNVYAGFDTDEDSKGYSIDPSTGIGCVKEHINFFESIKGANIVTRPDPDVLVNDIAYKPKEPRRDSFMDSIIYFLCHATYVEPIDESYVTLGIPKNPRNSEFKEGRITLGDIKSYFNKPLGEGTLVFMNACESAKIPVTFFDGFLPFFFEKYADGIIGTWSATPIKFASRFGLEFFKRLLQGDSVDQIMYWLRKKFLLHYNNPLGLCYFSRCSVGLGLKAKVLSFDKISIFEDHPLTKSSAR